MNTDQIEHLVVELSKSPFDPTINFNLAVEYERLNQTASAISFYLRAVEYGNNTHPLIVYSSLLRMSICFEGQKDRNWTVSGAILQAISYLPFRPEGYFLLSRFHERSGNWQEAYTFAEVGLSFSNRNFTYSDLPTWVEYPGEYGLLFEKAVSAWWVGRKNESHGLFKKLSELYLNEEYATAVKNNMERLGIS